MTGRQLIGVLVTAVVLFFMGFVYWGVNTMPYESWNAVGNDAEAQATLAELMPNDGVYFVPGFRSEAGAALLADGPLIQAYVDHSPVAPSDPSIFLYGFVVNLLTAALLTLLLRPDETFAQHLRTGAIVAALAVIAVEVSNMVWWQVPLSWQLHLSVYTVLVFLVGTAVTSFFVRPKAG